MRLSSPTIAVLASAWICANCVLIRDAIAQDYVPPAPPAIFDNADDSQRTAYGNGADSSTSGSCIRKPTTNCASKPCCRPQPKPSPPSGQAFAAPPPGAFAAPPVRGEVAGESGSVGLRGFSLQLPALRLELPTLQLPSLIRFRRDAEMRITEGYAPYVQGPAAVYGQIAPGGNVYSGSVATGQRYSANAAPRNGSGSAYAASGALSTMAEENERMRTELEEQRERMDEMNKKMKDAEECLRRLLNDQQSGRSPNNNLTRTPLDQGKIDRSATQPTKKLELGTARSGQLDDVWATPHALSRQQQQREMHALRTEIGELRGSLQTLVELQLQRMKREEQQMTSTTTSGRETVHGAAGHGAVIPANANFEQIDDARSNTPAQRTLQRSQQRRVSGSQESFTDKERMRDSSPQLSPQPMPLPIARPERSTQSPRKAEVEQRSASRNTAAAARKPRLFGRLKHLTQQLPWIRQSK
jgi:hypothetical protein